MPAALPEEIKEKAKLLSLVVGPREAARQLGLNEDTVCLWSYQGGWGKEKQVVEEALLKKYENQGVTAAKSKCPTEALVSLGPKSKLLGAKVGHSMLKTISKLKGLDQVALAQPFAQVTGSLKTYHSWGNDANSQAPLVNLTFQLGDTQVKDITPQ